MRRLATAFSLLSAITMATNPNLIYPVISEKLPLTEDQLRIVANLPFTEPSMTSILEGMLAMPPKMWGTINWGAWTLSQIMDEMTFILRFWTKSKNSDCLALKGLMSHILANHESCNISSEVKERAESTVSKVSFMKDSPKLSEAIQLEEKNQEKKKKEKKILKKKKKEERKREEEEKKKEEKKREETLLEEERKRQEEEKKKEEKKREETLLEEERKKEEKRLEEERMREEATLEEEKKTEPRKEEEAEDSDSEDSEDSDSSSSSSSSRPSSPDSRPNSPEPRAQSPEPRAQSPEVMEIPPSPEVMEIPPSSSPRAEEDKEVLIEDLMGPPDEEEPHLEPSLHSYKIPKSPKVTLGEKEKKESRPPPRVPTPMRQVKYIYNNNI